MRPSKHLEAVKPNVSAGVVNFGGALLDDPVKEGEALKINGSAMLISADSKEDAMKIIESDIYYKSGVWDPKKVRADLDWSYFAQAQYKARSEPRERLPQSRFLGYVWQSG